MPLSSNQTSDSKPSLASINDFTSNLQQQQRENQTMASENMDDSSNKNNNNNNNEEEEEEQTYMDQWNELTPMTRYTIIGASIAFVLSFFALSFWKFLFLSFLLLVIVFGVWFSQTNLSVEITVFLAKFFPPSSQAVWDTHKFKWTQKFRDNHNVIYQEYLDFEKNYNYCPQMDDAYPNGSITNWDRKWPTVTLRAYNLDCKISKYFPKTMALLNDKNNDYLISHCMYSIIEPDKFIPRHRGPYRGVFRYQLALEVPPIKDSERLYLAVWPNTSSADFWYPENVPDGEPQKCFWTVGEDFIFDDTCVHEVRNNTMFRRIILFMDIERHDVPLYSRILHRIFMMITRFLPAIQEIRKVQDKMIDNNVKIDSNYEIDTVDEPNSMRGGNYTATTTNDNNNNIDDNKEEEEHADTSTNNNSNNNNNNSGGTFGTLARVPEVAPYKRARILIEKQKKKAQMIARQKELFKTIKNTFDKVVDSNKNND